MILEFDGLHIRWETDIDWEVIRPQDDNNDEGYDNDSEIVLKVQEHLLYTRVYNMLQVERYIDHPERDALIENIVVEEIDRSYDSKRNA